MFPQVKPSQTDKEYHMAFPLNREIRANQWRWLTSLAGALSKD